MTLKTIRLLSVTLLIAVFTAAPSATNCYAQEKSQSPSPVRTNALALISELEAPINCSPDETLCFARIANARLEAAVAGLKAIVRADEQREGVIADMQTRINIRGGMIEDLQKVDVNSQRIDTLGQDSKALYESQHRDDKDTIGDLQQSLDSCRSNQKWIALVSGLGGGYIGYKLRGAGGIQNPFGLLVPTTSQLKASGIDFVNLQSAQEDRLRQALKNLQK